MQGKPVLFVNVIAEKLLAAGTINVGSPERECHRVVGYEQCFNEHKRRWTRINLDEKILVR